MAEMGSMTNLCGFPFSGKTPGPTLALTYAPCFLLGLAHEPPVHH